MKIFPYQVRIVAVSWLVAVVQMFCQQEMQAQVPPPLKPPNAVTASDGVYTNKVVITWQAISSPQAIYYHVYRALNTNTTKTELGAWQTGTNFEDFSAVRGQTYYYFVQASLTNTGARPSDYSVPDVGWSSLSSISAPLTITASDGTYADRVSISWSSVPTATHYKVYRSTSSSGAREELSSWIPSLSFDDRTGPQDQVRYYWVSAAKSAQGTEASGFSWWDTGWRWSGIALTPPTGVQASDNDYWDRVNITWSATNGNFFQVLRAVATNQTPEPVSPWMAGSWYSDPSVQPGQTYYYWVQAALDDNPAIVSPLSVPDRGSAVALAPGGDISDYVTVVDERNRGKAEVNLDVTAFITNAVSQQWEYAGTTSTARTFHLEPVVGSSMVTLVTTAANQAPRTNRILVTVVAGDGDDAIDATMGLGKPITTAFSSDGQTAAFVLPSRVVLWKLRENQYLSAVSLPSDMPPSGATLTADGMCVALVNSRGGVAFVNLDTSEVVFSQTNSGNAVTALSFSRDGQQLFTGGTNGSIYCWNRNNGQLVRQLIGHSSPVDSIASSPTVDAIASGAGDQIKIWDASSGSCLKTLQNPSGIEARHSRVRYSPDGTKLITSDDFGMLNLWDVAAGTSVFLGRHDSAIFSASISPNGQLAASGGGLEWEAYGEVKLWNINSRTQVWQRTINAAVSEVTFAPDSSALMLRLKNGDMVVWDVATGSPAHSFKLFGNKGACLALSQEAQSVYSAGNTFNDSVQIWQRTNGQLVRAINSYLITTPYDSFWASLYFISDLCSVGSNLVATSQGQVWNPASGVMITNMDLGWGPWPSRVAANASGTRMAVTQGSDVPLFDCGSWALISKLSVGGYSTNATALDFSPSTNWLAVAVSPGGKINIYNSSNGVWLKTISAHSDAINGLAFSASGKYLASGSDDASIKLWDVTTSTGVFTNTDIGQAIVSVDFSGDDNFVLAASADRINVIRRSTGRTIYARAVSGCTKALFLPDGNFIYSTSGGEINQIYWMCYDRWLAQYNVPGNQSGFQDCPAGDGIPNITKYIHGVAPTNYTPATALGLWQVSNGQAAYEYQAGRLLSDFSVRPEWSEVLSPANWSTTTIQLEKRGQDDFREQWKATLPTSNRNSLFLRLRAVPTP